MNYFASRTTPSWSQPKPQEPGMHKAKLRRFEIPLSSRPTSYHRGDGPPRPAPLSMILKNDSTARILDKRVLQGPPKNGELSLQLFYIVGWTDLPAARVAIQAQHIHEYVPPRVLEDFEYQLYINREAREEAEETAAAIEAVRRAEEAENAARGRKHSVPYRAKQGGAGRKRRKKQRPSKADLIAKQQAEETSFDQSEAVALGGSMVMSSQNAAGPSLAGLSLSTPKKKRELIPENRIIANSEEDALMNEGLDNDEMELDDDTVILGQLRETSTRTSESSESDTGDQTLRPPPQKPQKQQAHSGAAAEPIKTEPGTAMPVSAPISTPVPAPVKTTLQHYGFTPAARSTVPWPAASASQTPVLSQQASSVSSIRASPTVKTAEKPPRSNKKKAKTPEVAGEAEEEEEQVWEVKRLEGMRIENIDGKATRMFKVRWKGNWPPDQNPTWEPEENIDKPLVKKYLTKKGKTEDPKEFDILPPLRPPPLKRKWSSVAEAVMGDLEDEDEYRRRPPGPSGSGEPLQGSNNKKSAMDLDSHSAWPENNSGGFSPDDDDDDEGDDEILQVTEPGTETPSRSKEFNDALMRELETSFRRQDVRGRSQRSSSGSS